MRNQWYVYVLALLAGFLAPSLVGRLENAFGISAADQPLGFIVIQSLVYVAVGALFGFFWPAKKWVSASLLPVPMLLLFLVGMFSVGTSFSDAFKIIALVIILRLLLPASVGAFIGGWLSGRRKGYGVENISML